MDIPRKLWSERVVRLIALTLLMAYVGSYIVLSRRGFRHAESINAVGFYFFPPENTDTWRTWNYGLVKFYYPLILIDVWIGTGRRVASEPLWHLSFLQSGGENATSKVVTPRRIG